MVISFPILQPTTTTNLKGYRNLQPIHAEIYRRDLGVCALCGLECERLRMVLAQTHADWEDIYSLPQNLPQLLRCFEIAGRPRCKVNSWGQQIAEKVKHPDIGLAHLGVDAKAWAIATAIGAALKPPSFEAWLKGLGVWVSRYPHQLWDADHIVMASKGGSDELENRRTLCLGCHRERHSARATQER